MLYFDFQSLEINQLKENFYMKKQPKRHERVGVDRMGRTAFHYAALDSNAEKVKALIAEGIDPCLPDDNGWTALHASVQSWSYSICKIILDAGCNVDSPDLNGNTPLLDAVFNSRGRGGIIQLLLSYGADPLRVNNYDVSPLSLTKSVANYDVKQFFDILPENRIEK